MTRTLEQVLERLQDRLGDEAVAALVQAAEADALAEVRGLLKDLFVQALLQRAAQLPVDQTIAPVAAPPEAEVAAAAPAPASAPHPVDAAPADGAPAPPPGDAEGLYLYGIVPSALGRALPALTGVGDAPVTVLPAGVLAAVVSSTPFAAFDRDTLQERLDDPAWLDAYPYAHQRVQEAVLQQGALVPVRFGTLFHGAEAVRAYLGEHEADLTAALDHLDGRSEWNLKVWVDRATLTAWVTQQSDEVRGVQEAADARPEGTAYLLRKRLDKVVGDEIRRIEGECAAAIHAGLAALAADTSGRTLLTREGGGPRLIAHQAYLVDDDALPAFEAEVRAASARFAELGITAEVSGPWPAYSFVGLPAHA